MKKRFIIPLIIIFSVILSICVSAQPSQADTPLENSESYTDVSVQESANQLYESLMSAFNSANGKNSSTPSQLSYPDAYGGAYINDSGKLVRNSKKMYVIQMQSYLHRALEQLKPSHHGLLDNPQEMHQIKGLSL